MCAVIEEIIAVKEKFKADYIIDILQGRETSEVQAHLHEDLEVFGSCLLYTSFSIFAGIIGAFCTCWFAGVMNAVDLEYGLQYMFNEWFGEPVDSSWNFDGEGWALDYVSLNN